MLQGFHWSACPSQDSWSATPQRRCQLKLWSPSTGGLSPELSCKHWNCLNFNGTAVKILQGSLLVCISTAGCQVMGNSPISLTVLAPHTADKIKSSPSSVEHWHGSVCILLLQNWATNITLYWEKSCTALLILSLSPADLEQRSQKKRSELGVFSVWKLWFSVTATTKRWAALTANKHFASMEI